MTGRLYMFRGSEADNDQPMSAHIGDDRRRVPEARPFFIADDAPETDDERELRAADWPTTRRFARSAHGPDAAWPKDPAYGDAFDRFSDSFIEQDVQRLTLFRKWRSIFATAGVLALMAGLGVLLAWRG